MGISARVHIQPCHLKGSYEIINLFKDRLEKQGLTEKITLNAAFCLGECTSGVTIKVDDEVICGVSEDNFDEIFEKSVLKSL